MMSDETDRNLYVARTKTVLPWRSPSPAMIRRHGSPRAAMAPTNYFDGDAWVNCAAFRARTVRTVGQSRRRFDARGMPKVPATVSLPACLNRTLVLVESSNIAPQRH